MTQIALFIWKNFSPYLTTIIHTNNIRAAEHISSVKNDLETDFYLGTQTRRVKNESPEDLIRIYRWQEEMLVMAALS